MKKYLDMVVVERIESIVERTCDVCKSVVLHYNNSSPTGWCTTKKDHSNSVCPECNPWLTRTKEADMEKLNKIK